jgi:protocatechuate 3,4-dioxygenase beta subunit
MLRTILFVLTIGVVFALTSSPGAYAAGEASRAVFWAKGDPGQRLHLRGRVVAPDGRPVANATIAISQADGDGAYIERYRARITSDKKGEWFLISALPGQYAGNKHIHIAVAHPDFAPLHTEILFKGDSEHGSHEETVALEEAQINGETVFLGRFEVKLQGS